ncbi:heterokaryon incompatibility [Podospora didyma]|uniref:Heterokaryon incompatibility n=1 Tax=Podospora didyma TaxID=330526 RepID=A0AAE0KAW7_9PEZI|nr:heterokaryon incompatibility [Podospora didyma]
MVLKPSHSADDPIQCKLIPMDLDTPAKYTTLSCEEGTADPPAKITCEGKSLQATPNRELALKRMRHSRNVQLFWVDAICIDQTSIPERNHQVSMMGDIYRRAARVNLWLGPGDDLSAKEFSDFRRLQVLAWVISHCIPSWLSSSDLPNEMTIRPGSGGGLQKLIIDSFFLGVATKSHWTRAWTIQE